MSRYIDAEKIEYHEIYDGQEFVRVAYGDDIDNTPTADVVPKEIADEAYAHGYTEAESKYRAILERKRGEWIDTGSGQECSICKEIQYGYDSARNFCANCGAEMREGREDAIPREE